MAIDPDLGLNPNGPETLGDLLVDLIDPGIVQVTDPPLFDYVEIDLLRGNDKGVKLLWIRRSANSGSQFFEQFSWASMISPSSLMGKVVSVDNLTNLNYIPDNLSLSSRLKYG
jgi:hypothetical protein